MTKILEGLRILDFSRVLAAPMGTQALAEMGAEVIKVERPHTGDETRGFEPRLAENESAYFFAFNRGKKSVTLDLKSEEGYEEILRLVRDVDVVVENFVPGTMEKMGLGYEELAKINENIVYVSCSGFGQSGPMSQERGYDTIFQALSGIIDLTGHPDGDPAKVGVPIADMTSGLWIAIAILTGITGKHLHGKGCHIDMSMLDVQLSLLALPGARVFALDEDPTRTGTEHLGRVPSAAVKCADNRWVHISGSDQHWVPLCEAMNLPELAHDEALSTNAGRLAHRDRVMDSIRAAAATMEAKELEARLKANGVPAGLVQTAREALTADHAVAREIVGEFDHPTVGKFNAIRTPIRFDGFEDPEILPPPVLGEHNDLYLASERSKIG